MAQRALGTVIDWNPQEPLGQTEYYSGLLDYYDWWGKVDPRLAKHHDYLSPPAFAFGHDLGNMAAYANEILRWLAPRRIRQAPSVVVVSSMAEAYFFSVRSACDAIASALAYVATKPGQAPSNSLRALVEWANKNETRVHPEVLAVLRTDLDWFWKLRRIRDDVAHGYLDISALCDGRQFDLLMFPLRKKEKASREPMMPLLAQQLVRLVELSNSAAEVINRIIDLPAGRKKSRVLSGVLVPALHRLVKVAPNYPGVGLPRPSRRTPLARGSA